MYGEPNRQRTVLSQGNDAPIVQSRLSKSDVTSNRLAFLLVENLCPSRNRYLFSWHLLRESPDPREAGSY